MKLYGQLTWKAQDAAMDKSNKQMKNQEIKGSKMTKFRIIYMASLVIPGVLWGIASSPSLRSGLRLITLLAMTKRLGFFPDRSGIKIRANEYCGLIDSHHIDKLNLKKVNNSSYCYRGTGEVFKGILTVILWGGNASHRKMGV